MWLTGAVWRDGRPILDIGEQALHLQLTDYFQFDMVGGRKWDGYWARDDPDEFAPWELAQQIAEAISQAEIDPAARSLMIGSDRQGRPIITTE